MNKRQLVVTWLAISIILSGCAPAYRFVNTEKIKSGYTVQKGNIYLPYFTIDRSKQYPKELKLAKKRFKRRRRVVEKYYKEINPELFENYFISFAKTIPFYLFYPFAVIIMRFRGEPRYKETEEWGLGKRKKDKEKIEQYIEEDSKIESLSE